MPQMSPLMWTMIFIVLIIFVLILWASVYFMSNKIKYTLGIQGKPRIKKKQNNMKW